MNGTTTVMKEIAEHGLLEGRCRGDGKEGTRYNGTGDSSCPLGQSLMLAQAVASASAPAHVSENLLL